MTTEQEEKAAIEFINKILAKCKGKECIFRGTTQIFSGQENVPGKKDGINSSLYRWAVDQEKVKFHNHYFPQDIEREIVAKAQEHFPSATSNIEMLTEIQHYRGETNCIDFSRNLYIALFFACSAEDDKEGELIMLDIKGLELITKIEYNKRPPELIEIIKPTITHTSKPRVTFQASIFVRSQKGYLDINSDMLETEAIPTRLKKPILEHLNTFHAINADSIYNDLIGVIANKENLKNALKSSQLNESKLNESKLTQLDKPPSTSVVNQNKNIETAEIYFYKGLSFHNNGEYHLAIENYTQAIELNPNLSEAYNNRGDAHFVLTQFQKAIKDYTKLIELNSNDAEVYNNRGAAHFVLTQFQEAIHDFTKAIDLNPKYAGAYYNRGNVHAKIENYQEAIQDFTKAIELKSDFAEAYYNRGSAHAELKHYQEAIRNYSKAIELNPNDAEAYNNRGLTHAKLTHHQEAIHDYSKAIDLKLKYTEAYHNRGIAHLALSRYQEALHDFNKVIEFNPKYTEAYHNRGIAHFMLIQHQEAIRDFNKATKLNPNHAKAYYARGLVYDVTGEHKKAEQNFAKALQLDPDGFPLLKNNDPQK